MMPQNITVEIGIRKPIKIRPTRVFKVLRVHDAEQRPKNVAAWRGRIEKLMRLPNPVDIDTCRILR
eukprot:1029929-Rhodomonas_salina.1